MRGGLPSRRLSTVCEISVRVYESTDLGADLAASILEVQRRAYAVEAALIDDDRIPYLHETLDELRFADLSWFVAICGVTVEGALAWTGSGDCAEIDRLVVSPQRHRAGIGRRLVREVLAANPGRRVRVATTRANAPAWKLYESAGFECCGADEVAEGLWVSRYELLVGTPQ